MVRAYLWADDAWPTIDVDVSTNDDAPYELSDELYARYVAAAHEWKDVQKILRDMKDPTGDL